MLGDPQRERRGRREPFRILEPIVASSRPVPGATDDEFPRAVRPSPAAQEAVVELLRAIGEDPEREGLRDTPHRFVSSLLELTRGSLEDPAVILGRVFEDPYDEMVAVRAIPFTSLCEHHLLPVEGVATVAYLPAGRVVGLSKLSRLVQTYARRLQLQERFTRQIADALDEHLAPRGAAVHVHAHHACMGLRGVRTPAAMVTSAFRGAMRDPGYRREFLDIANAASGV